MKTKEERIISLSELEVGELLKEVQNRGYYIAKTPIQVSGQTFKGDLKRWNGRKYKFGVVSDTHLGSRYQQITHLHEFYRICQRRGIETMFHCGDICDGGGGANVYRGHEFEIFAHGADAQTDYAIAHYPKYKGMKTVLISGNHDQVYMKVAGYNMARKIAEQRDDITYVGDDLAFIEIDNIRVALMHGRQGLSYARSYRLQKHIENLSSENKPHFLFLGHYHSANILTGYRNVEGILMPCFQAQTPFLAALGLNPFVAGLIVELQTDESGLAKVQYQWIPFYRAKKNDF